MIMARETTCSTAEENDKRRLWSAHNKKSSLLFEKESDFSSEGKTYLQLARIDKQSDENLNILLFSRHFSPVLCILSYDGLAYQ